jgi:hypothetical protein
MLNKFPANPLGRLLHFLRHGRASWEKSIHLLYTSVHFIWDVAYRYLYMGEVERIS